MLNYISNTDLLNIFNSFDAAIMSSNFKVAKAIKDTVSEWWNKANSGLIDFESLDFCYDVLTEMVHDLDHFQAELFGNRDHRGHEDNDLEHENNKLARENEMLKSELASINPVNDRLYKLAEYRQESERLKEQVKHFAGIMFEEYQKKEVLKRECFRLKGELRCMEDAYELRAEMIKRLQADNDNLDRSLDVANQALYNIHRYAKS